MALAVALPVAGLLAALAVGSAERPEGGPLAEPLGVEPLVGAAADLVGPGVASAEVTGGSVAATADLAAATAVEVVADVVKL